MTSPVDTSVKNFNNAMLSAPVLNGTAGSLINILDACLVTGFDTKTANSLVVAGGVATLSYTGTHSATIDSVILVANASIAALNGEQRVIYVAAGVVRFATATADGTDTGTVTFKMASAGWEKTFIGTNLAAYRSTNVMGTRMTLRVDDTAAQVVRVCGYEVMADVNTGTGLFPTVAQYAAPGLWWSKSNAADTSFRPWAVIADSRGFYYFPHSERTYDGQGNYFGDIISNRSNDPYACILRANVSDKSNSYGGFGDELVYNDSNMSYDGCYIARSASSLGGAQRVATAMATGAGIPSAGVIGQNGFPFPSPVDNGLNLYPLMVHSTSQGVRGYLPGLFGTNQIVSVAFSNRDIVAGTGAAAGKKVLVQKLGSQNQGVLFLTHTDAWRA